MSIYELVQLSIIVDLSECRLTFNKMVEEFINYKINTITDRLFDQSRLNSFEKTRKETLLSDNCYKSITDSIIFVVSIILIL